MDPVPAAGRHTGQTLAELGRSRSDIEELCAPGVVETGGPYHAGASSGIVPAQDNSS